MGDSVQQAPKWRRKAHLRPRQIAEAALEVFGEAGLIDATVDEIAGRAGVSKGTIYLYFPNKEELFLHCIRDALASIDEVPINVGLATPTDQLRDSIARVWGALAFPPGATVQRLVAAEQWRFPEVAELYHAKIVDRLEKELGLIIRLGIADGDFRPLEPSIAARMLTGLVLQAATWAGVPNRGKGGQTSAERLREVTEFSVGAVAQTAGAFAQADGAPDRRGVLNN